MTALSAFLLGLLQALTEFLPVSSSGHLRLAHDLFGWEGESDLLFDLLLHVGTLLAVVAVYGGDLLRYARDAFGALRGAGTLRERWQRSEGLQMFVWVVVATVPTGVLGLLLSPLLRSDVFSVPVVGALLVCNGFWLRLSRRAPDDDDDAPSAPLRFRDALLIGLAQGVAVLPGISRSGATIVTALLLGTRRMHAARLSFLLSIPAILGATVLEFDREALLGTDAPVLALAVGITTAAVGGAVALKLLLRLLREARFAHFAWYCWAVGAGAITLWLVGL